MPTRKILKTKKLKWAIGFLLMVLLVIGSTSLAFGETETLSRYTRKTYTHSSSLDGYVIVDGVDVSEFQGNIDWAKAKADGIDYAIIRVGGRGFTSGKLYSDTKFARNMKYAKKNGIMVGVYFFSQATTKKKARAEVNYAVKLIEEAGYTAEDLDLPLFMDYESAGGSDGLLYGMSKEQGTIVAKEWMNHAASKGYTPGIYTDLFFGKTKVNGKTLSEDYNYWAAQYYIKNQFAFEYCWWQYSSSGKVYGIDSGYSDMNFWYIKPYLGQVATRSTGLAGDSIRVHSGFVENLNSTLGDVTKPIDEDRISLTGTEGFVYDGGTPYKPSKVTVTDANGITLTKDEDYKLRYIKNTQAGTAYAIAIGTGEYSGYIMAPYEIARSRDIDSLTIAGIPDMKYTGEKITPSVNITDKNGKPLVRTADYVLKGTDNIETGTATLKITYKGNYRGSRTVNFNIIKGDQVINIKDTRKTTLKEKGAYNLGASVKFPTTLTYTSSNPKVAKVDSTGKVTPLKVGTTTITIKAKSTKNVNYAERKITLNVKTDVLSSSERKLRDAVKAMDFTLNIARTKKGVKLTWKKNGTKKLNKIQIYRSTVKRSGYKKIYTKPGKAKEFTNSGRHLKRGKRYYYKIRGYRIIHNKRFYTKWSNTVSRKWR